MNSLPPSLFFFHQKLIKTPLQTQGSLTLARKERERKQKEKTPFIVCHTRVGRVFKGLAEVGIQDNPFPTQTLLLRVNVPHWAPSV